ncbi:LLM class flavin-dependent oxidoreductase [Planctomonas sp. JC2975]|uniref:LLM class flavin-dependent oxidoreductase n=1 Tax=Planctomonas sp. JC2975 TaxID=2729626 RepID=UPI0014756FE3|nr:LLM class flavin-dependent oxidoreductase [Planctomonas sp. JC2975]NNC13021.1 LLM class flavin-dependent oxidoreductase [Planctomonas sp. JC2975]
MTRADVSIGVAGLLGADAVGRLAPVIEQCGFRSLWVNDTPGGDSLAALAAAADATTRLGLATGVIPVDRRRGSEIVDAVQRMQLPEHRLVLGVGSGGARKGALALVGEAVDTLHEETSARILTGALGPKMRELGAREADGVLLSWLTPEVAAEQAESAHAVASDAHVALYVRTAVDPSGVARLREEARRYSGYPAYAANFARLGVEATDTVLEPETFVGRIAEYRRAVDEVVLRVMTSGDTVEEHERFILRAAELLAD